jgi:hypothetical protein
MDTVAVSDAAIVSRVERAASDTRVNVILLIVGVAVGVGLSDELVRRRRRR